MEPETEAQLIKTVTETHEMVGRLNVAVMGDDEAGIPGHGKRLIQVEEKADKTDRRVTTGLAKFYAIGGTLSFIWGVVIVFKDKIFS